ncbi:MAG: hypothetical protein WBO55_16530 [Rhizobiaceae bacterium]
MTIGVSICRVSRVPAAAEMAELNAEHHAVYGGTVGELKILRDPKDPNQTAAVFQINDLDGFLAVARSPEGDALMRKWGVVEPLSFFHEDT